ncbi:MAG: hypothetical protein AVDCRST_MAG93-164, partial [uncultured Chloroflexia bacterium]
WQPRSAAEASRRTVFTTLSWCPRPRREVF